MLRFRTDLVNYCFTMQAAQRDSGRYVAISCTVCGKHHSPGSPIRAPDSGDIIMLPATLS